jgi:hypothetical protein
VIFFCRELGEKSLLDANSAFFEKYSGVIFSVYHLDTYARVSSNELKIV